MAVEVALGKYYFTTDSEDTVDQVFDVHMDKLFEIQLPTSFAYNPLHDIESLWWVLLWVVLSKVPSTTPSDDQDELRTHRDKVLEAFPQRGHGRRGIVIKWGFTESYLEYANHMTPAMRPYLLHLLRMKRVLTNSYYAAEAALSAGGDINPTAWLTTHQAVINEINKVFRNEKCHDLTLF